MMSVDMVRMLYWTNINIISTDDTSGVDIFSSAISTVEQIQSVDS